jgi:hypothetical protein
MIISCQDDHHACIYLGFCNTPGLLSRPRASLLMCELREQATGAWSAQRTLRPYFNGNSMLNGLSRDPGGTDD